MNTDLLLELLLNPCGMLAAGAVMYVAGDWASAGEEGLRRFGAALAGAALIGAMSYGISHRLELFGLAFGAAGFGLFVLGTTWIVLSLLSFIVSALMAAMTPSNHDVPKPEVFVLPEPEPGPEPEPPPPPPTTEEMIEAAKERHEEKIRALQASGLTGLEMQSALEQAKKDYLRDIDRVMGK